MIKTVIFDIGNVMVDFGFRKMIERTGYPKEVLDRIEAATVESGFWKELDRGVMEYEEVLAIFAAKDPQIEEQMRCALENLEGIVTMRTHAVPWVRALKKAGYQVLALSNYPKKAYEEGKKELAFLEAYRTKSVDA